MAEKVWAGSCAVSLSRSVSCAFALALGLVTSVAQALAASQSTADPDASVSRPAGAILFNEDEIRAQRRQIVDLDEPLDVLGFVLGQAGEDITVFPSEGYYYFEFQTGPSNVRGNIRFDLVDAADGKLDFAYYSPATNGRQD